MGNRQRAVGRHGVHGKQSAARPRTNDPALQSDAWQAESPDEHVAKDLTQGFFERFLEKEYFRDADQLRGRFRSFLLACVKNFLANERD